MTTTTQRQIHFVPDGDTLPPAAAEAVVAAVEKAIASRGFAAVSLSGGSTAGRLFEMLASGSFATRLQPLWPHVHVFWTTERHVRPDHPESCYRLAHWSLLSRCPIPGVNVHRIRAEMADGAAAAAAYQRELRRFFEPRRMMRDGLPCLDLAILTLDSGESLTPVEPSASGARRWVTTRTLTSERVEIGLTLPVLRNARHFLGLFSNDASSAGRAAHLLRFVA